MPETKSTTSILSAIRTQLFGDCMAVLLAGYFLVSSLNLVPVPGGTADSGTQVRIESGVVRLVLSFFADSEPLQEECAGKTSTGQDLVAADFMLPCAPDCVEASALLQDTQPSYKNPVSRGLLYFQIHVPPPEICWFFKTV